MIVKDTSIASLPSRGISNRSTFSLVIKGMFFGGVVVGVVSFVDEFFGGESFDG